MPNILTERTNGQLEKTYYRQNWQVEWKNPGNQEYKDHVRTLFQNLVTMSYSDWSIIATEENIHILSSAEMVEPHAQADDLM